MVKHSSNWYIIRDNSDINSANALKWAWVVGLEEETGCIDEEMSKITSLTLVSTNIQHSSTFNY